MKKLLNYYYGFDLINYTRVNNGYIILYKGNKYHFYRLENLFVLSKKKELLNILEKNVYMNCIINNRDNSAFTYDGKKYYVMFKINMVFDKQVDIDEVLKFYQLINGFNIVGKRNFVFWIKLWRKKIDYLEYFLSKNNNISNNVMWLAYYYMGMGENAIEYLKLYMISHNSKYCNVVTAFVHDRININNYIFDLYNPFNIVIDSRTRDISEYIKSLFICKRLSTEELVKIIKKTNYNEAEYALLIARIIFPTFFFDVLEAMSFDDEQSIKRIIDLFDSINNYEILINLVIDSINKVKKTNLNRFDWIK